MKVDLHLHSKFSWDSKVPIETYIALAETNGIGAISITDHNNTESHQIIRKLQKHTHVILIPGQEINTSDGHLLVYGWISTLPRDLSMEETVYLAKKSSAGDRIVCIAAHPFDKLRGGRGKNVLGTGIDGIETLNASVLFGYFNRKAERSVRGTNLFRLGNSDSHKHSEFAFAYSIIPRSESIQEVLRNLKDAKPSGKRIGILRKSHRFFWRKLGRMPD